MRNRLLILGILFIAAVLRLHGLTSLGLEHDEVANWLIDRSILDEGNLAIYYTRAYGHEGGFHLLQAASVGLVGDNALALRLPGALAGIMLVAVSYALARRLFGRETALLAAGLLAVLFWPIFYSRLGLRAITLPVLSGLSAIFWWRAWGKGAGEQRSGGDPLSPLLRPSAPLLFGAAGLFAGLSLYTYMAARAVPIFYGLYIGYLMLYHRPELKKRWRGVLVFAGVMTAVALPLFIFLKANPGAEYRISEIDAPLMALRSGNLYPILENGLKILGMFGFAGDPLWRQNVAQMPVFDPVIALFFYVSLAICLRRFKDKRHAFLLLWLSASITPSLVTINAPSSIRMINSLPILTLFPAIVIHNSRHLSTVLPRLSTEIRKIGGQLALTILFLYYIGWTVWNIFGVWPGNEEVQFVWQAALLETAVWLDDQPNTRSAGLAGWSPDTMDSPTMALSMRREDVTLSHFNPADGILLIPNDKKPVIIRPSALPFDRIWEEKIRGDWGAEVFVEGLNTRYLLPVQPTLQPPMPVHAHFGEGLELIGIETMETAVLSYWRVLSPPTAPRRIFLHWLNEDGSILAEDYRLDTLDPQSLWFPHWQAGDLIMLIHPIPEGETSARIRLGVFNPTSCTPGPCQNLETSGGEPFVVLDWKPS